MTAKTLVTELFLKGKQNVHKFLSYFAYTCKTEGKNDISRLISETA